MRFKKWVVICALLGITIFYDTDDKFGVVWTSNSGGNTTILASPNTNTVVMYDADGRVSKYSWSDFLAWHGEIILKNLAEARTRIITIPKNPAPQEAPKIQY